MNRIACPTILTNYLELVEFNFNMEVNYKYYVHNFTILVAELVDLVATLKLLTSEEMVERPEIIDKLVVVTFIRVIIIKIIIILVYGKRLLNIFN